MDSTPVEPPISEGGCLFVLANHKLSTKSHEKEEISIGSEKLRVWTWNAHTSPGSQDAGHAPLLASGLQCKDYKSASTARHGASRAV
jgi:hypothetical protein